MRTLLLTAQDYEYLFWKYRLTRFGMRSVFRFQKEREETNQTDGNKKNLAIFEDEKPSIERQIHVFKEKN